jgi:hypothetical protein
MFALALGWRDCLPCWAMKGLADVPDSGVKKGDVVGLRGAGENEDAVSVKALCRDVWLSEWKGAPLLKSG